MNRWIKPAGVIAVVLLAAAAFLTRGRGTEVAAADAAPEFDVAARRSLEVTAEAAGLIEPIRLVEVKSKASGEITRLLVETGDAVRRGELLADVDPRDVRNAFAQADADLEVARARLTTAEAQKKRSQELLAANVITEQEWESATFEEANARAQFVKARTNVDLAQERLSDVTIRAPIDGVIIRKDVEEGQIIQSASQNISGGTTILMMADLSQMQVRTLVNETDLGKIQPGMQARVSVEAFPGRAFEGTVAKIEPQAVIEQNVTMFPVLVQLENRDGALKPGMNAEVVVEVARRQDVVTIPNAAVVATRDAAAAGVLFGISDDRMRTALRGGRGDSPGAAVAAADGHSNGAATDGPSNSAAAPAPNGPVSGSAAPAPNGAAGLNGGDGAAARPQAGPAGTATQMRPAGGPGGAQARNARGPRLGTGDVRPAVVFVQTDAGIEPRSVLLGVNDWDYTEVIRGIEPGEQVILMSVARLQQQQQEMLNRMRERNAGPFPGASSGPAAGRGR